MSQWITCALNGGTLSRDNSPFVPITPQEIAQDACAAARAGAAVVHCHVRDPKTGLASNDPDLFAELVSRIREREPDLIVNLTGGGGGTLTVGLADPVLQPDAAAAILSAERRLAHLGTAGADMTGLDCGSFSYGTAGEVYLSPTDMLHRAAAFLGRIDVRPELTAFDLGQMALAADMVEKRLVPVRTPFCLGFGVIWGAPARLSALEAMLDILPAGADWSAFSKGEAGQRLLAPRVVERGGGLRTGLEDHHTHFGKPIGNPRLVEEAVAIMRTNGVTPMSAAEVRQHLALKAR